MAQYSHFRRTGTNLKTAGVSPQVAWYGIATMSWRHRSTFVLEKYNYMKYRHAIQPADEDVILMR